jgi:hypothetical protein
MAFAGDEGLVIATGISEPVGNAFSSFHPKSDKPFSEMPSVGCE